MKTPHGLMQLCVLASSVLRIIKNTPQQSPSEHCQRDRTKKVGEKRPLTEEKLKNL